MTGPGHHATGFFSGVIAASICYKLLGLPFLISISSLPLAIWGSLFPDSIESFMGFRWFRHRTISHWVPLWLLGLVAALYLPVTSPLGSAIQAGLVGFTVGGLTHLIFDWPNPLGIPFLTPYRRHSLKLWNSGKREGLIVLVWAGIASLFWLPEIRAMLA